MKTFILSAILVLSPLLSKGQTDIYDLTGYWDKFQFGMSLSETIAILKEYSFFKNEGFNIDDNELSVYNIDFAGIPVNSATFYFDDNDKLTAFHFSKIYDEKDDARYALSRLKTIFDSRYTYAGQTNRDQSPYTDLIDEEKWRDANKRNIAVRINWIINCQNI